MRMPNASTSGQARRCLTQNRRRSSSWLETSALSCVVFRRDMEDGAGTSSALYANPIAFSDFCMLLQKIRTIKPRRTSQPRHQSWKELEYTRKWIHLARQEYAELPTGTIVIFFRLLFPDEGVRRRSAACLFHGTLRELTNACIDTISGSKVLPRIWKHTSARVPRDLRDGVRRRWSNAGLPLAA